MGFGVEPPRWVPPPVLQSQRELDGRTRTVPSFDSGAQGWLQASKANKMDRKKQPALQTLFHQTMASIPQATPSQSIRSKPKISTAARPQKRREQTRTVAEEEADGGGGGGPGHQEKKAAKVSVLVQPSSKTDTGVGRRVREERETAGKGGGTEASRSLKQGSSSPSFHQPEDTP